MAGMTDDQRRNPAASCSRPPACGCRWPSSWPGSCSSSSGTAAYSNLANTHSLESAAGVSLLLVALIVWMLNWMYRLSIRSNEEREAEERAREYFDRTGRWPDEE